MMNTVFLDAGTLSPIQLRSDQSEQLSPKHFDIDISRLAHCCESLILFNQTDSKQRLDRCRNAQHIITNKVVINAELMDQLPQLELICVAATGYNNIDILAAKERNISVCNVAGYSTQSVVQICFQLLLQLNNHYGAVQTMLIEKGWQNHPEFVMLPKGFSQLEGKTMTIIGHGTIGKAVSKVAQAFGLKIVLAQLPERDLKDGYTPLEQALSISDFVSLHCPLTDETSKLVNQAFIDKLKPGALLINTARGGLLDEDAVAEALHNGTLAGLGCDVLSTEPPSHDNPLLTAPNVVITPHIGWASIEARQTLVNELAKNIDGFIHSKPRNIIV